MATNVITAPPGGVPAIDSWRWRIVWLMFLATMINYMDRQALGSTAAYIKSEFGLSEQGYGWLEFWFGLSYGLMQFPAGALADRLNLRWLYAGALLLWSAAGFFTGMSQTIVALTACRVLLGIGESFNWTCAVGIVRRMIPLESRSFANGIFHSGASLGAVVTPLLALVLIGPDGEHWRTLFLIVGGLGVVWAALWFWAVRGPYVAEIAHAPREDPPDERAASAARFSLVLGMRKFWVAIAVFLCVNLCWHFYRIWLPRFLDVDLKLDQREIQWTLAGFFIAADVGSLTAGYLTRRLTRAGYSVEWSRKLVLLGCAILCLLSTPAALAMTPWVTLPLLFVVGAASMGGFANIFALAQEISARHTALCVGIFGSFAWLCIAVVQPPIGALVDRLGTFAPSIIAVGFIPLVGAGCAFLWPEPTTDPRATRS